ncbi:MULTISPECIES: hypothetical protein [unclassified Pseudomonas]|jgi:hypothetical protein|uniref:hypothetical protein n=1 Tax=unclassified Pseudomonas TaxID=196821 RepID=UPI001030AFC0|nr:MULTISPECIES: hypothetical protein [unclassified Pseudomonas]
MELSQEAINQIDKEMKAAIDSQGDMLPADISAESLCNNKELILGFLQTLTGLIPSVFGKLAGQGVLMAAKAWFKHKGC